MYIDFLINGNDYEYETDGYAFLKTLTVEQLTEALVYVDPDEDYSEMSKKELIELLVKEDLYELFDSWDIKDFYYEDAEREYEEVQQQLADIIYETYRDRL